MGQRETGRTALLLLDFQPVLLDGIADSDALISRAAELKARAVEADVPVFCVIVQFREGYPEISDRNKSFSALRQGGILQAHQDSAAIHPRLATTDRDIVVVKPRVGAFYGTELRTLLGARGVDALIVGGIFTGGAVLTTTRVAADLDYRITVVADCVADPDAEVHDILLRTVFPKQATVAAADEVAAGLRA